MTQWFVMIIGVGLAVAAGLAVFVARRGSSGSDPGRTGFTPDARGRRVRLIDPWMAYTLGRRGAIDPAALERIADELEPGVRQRQRLMWFGLAIGVLVLAGVGVMVAIEGGPAVSDLVSTITNPAIIACLAGGTIAPWMATRQERLRRVKGVMLRHRCCPHCGYGLTGVPPDGEDGATVCPECACAWRVDDAATADLGPPPSSASTRASVVLLLAATALAGLFACGVVVYLAMR